MEKAVSLSGKIIIEDTGKKLALPDEIKCGVDSYWSKLLEKYPLIFNGPVYSVISCDNSGDVPYLKVALTDYAHYKYSELHDLSEYACHNLYAGCKPITRDGYIVCALNGAGTEFCGKIQGIGGAVDPVDRQPGSSLLDVEITAARELTEEAGPEIRDSIFRMSPGHLLMDGIKYGISMNAYSSMTANEMENSFTRYKAQSGNNEIDRLMFFGMDNMDELMHYKDCQDIGVVEMICRELGCMQNV